VVSHLPESEPDAKLVEEALRLYDRYAVEVVERLDLCPWARRARREGAVARHVFLQESADDLQESLLQIEALERLAPISIGLFIYPRIGLGRLDFEHFVRRLRHADSTLHEPGQIPFAMAAFHPEAKPELSDPDRLVPFLRRSPDPTIQLVRREVLDAVRGEGTRGTAFAEAWMLDPQLGMIRTEPGIRERIALNNLETIQRLGPASVEAILDDIALDRRESYARIQAERAEASEESVKR
jgi:hypothetical protein